MKILLVPYIETQYYKTMLNGFADAFRGKGHEVFVLSGVVSISTIQRYVEIEKINLVITINRFIGDSLNLKVPVFCWIQDIFLNTEESISNYLGENEYIYTLGDPEVLGFRSVPQNYLGPLMTGVDEKIIRSDAEVSWTRDISICGYLPSKRNIKFNRSMDLCLNSFLPKYPTIYQYLSSLISRDYLTKKVIMTVQDMVESLYEPLRGELNIVELESRVINILGIKLNSTELIGRSAHLLDHVADYYEPKVTLFRNFNQLVHSKIARVINYYVHTYPRFLDRQLLADTLISSFPNKVIEFYGYGWTEYKKYQNFSFPHIDSVGDLHEVYRSSKINLNNNTHGIGLHSRVLESMAVGGFVMTHRSGQNDSKDGGILSSFEEGTHFGFYDKDNFRDSIEAWLSDDAMRAKAIKKAQERIREEHLWIYRVDRVLKDYSMVLDRKS